MRKKQQQQQHSVIQSSPAQSLNETSYDEKYIKSKRLQSSHKERDKR